MNRILSQLLITAALTLTLSACSSITEMQDKTEQGIERDAKLAKKIREQSRKYEFIRFSQNLYVPPVTTEESKLPEWWYNDIQNARGIDVRLDDAIAMIVSSYPINVKFDDDVNPAKLVTFYGSSVGEALESIGYASGYAINVDAKNVLNLTKYQTEVFEIAAPPTEEAFGQGKQATGGDSESDKTLNSEEEYSRSSGKVSPMQELLQEIKMLSSFRYDDEGKLQEENIPIYVNSASSTITVKDRPANIERMRKVIYKFNERVRTQVVLKMELISVKIDSDTSQAFDVQAVVTDAFNGAMDITTSAIEGGSSFIGKTSVPSNVISGKWKRGDASGSTLLAELLKSYGAVSTRTVATGLTSHNTMGTLKRINRISYINERSNTQTANVGSDVSIIQAVLDVGLALYYMPTVYKNDVTVRLTSNISSLISLERNGITSANEDTGEQISYVESPNTSLDEFNSRFTVQDGDVLVVAGIGQENKSVDRSKAGHDILGFSDSSSTERVEYVLAITTQIIRPRQ